MELIINKKNKYLQSELEKYGQNCKVKIASAFFTNRNLVEKMLENNCEIELIVRLGEGTSSQRLKDIVDKENIKIRYYTSREFHPKIYIFEKNIAIIGSSNFTDSGCTSNSEANILIKKEVPIFEDVKNHFDDLWDNAFVLDKEILEEFHKINSIYSDRKYKLDVENKKNLKKFHEKYGSNNPSDIFIEKKKKNLRLEMKNRERKIYQNFLFEFGKLEKIYIGYGERRVTEDELPLRIEIDNFISWVKDYIMKTNPKLSISNTNERILKVHSLLKNYITSDSELCNIIIEKNYPILKESFRNKKAIKELSKESLKLSLFKLHSFSGQARFYGGKDDFFEEFYYKNGEDKIKNTLINLLYGDEKFESRIIDYICGENKLWRFSESCAKELIGWLNKENIPIYNMRTYEVMKYLGFDL